MVSPVSGSSIPGVSSAPTAPITVSGGLNASSIEQAAQDSALALTSSRPELSISAYHATVSEAVRQQLAADIISRFSDGEVRRQMFLNAIVQANEAAALFQIASRYKTLQTQLQGLNFDLNYAQLLLAAANLQDAYGTASEPDLLNTAINSLNQAQDVYNSYLPTYTAGLNAYNNALAAYQPAADTWKSLIEAYLMNPSQANETALLNGQSAFDAAEATFAQAQNTFAPINSAMSSRTNVLIIAENLYSSALIDYNDFLSSISAEVTAYSQIAQTWNENVSSANIIIAEMNALAVDLKIPSVNSVSSAPAAPVQYTTPTPIFSQNKADAFSAFSNVQDSANALNGTITIINSNLIIANSSLNPDIPATPTVLSPSSGALLDLIPPPPERINPPYPEISPLLSLVIAPPNILYFNPLAHIPSLNSLVELANQIAKINQQDDSTNDSPFAKISNRAALEVTTGGSGSSTQLTNINPVAQAQNPFLTSTLSQQAWESIFSVYGVPINSPLVDQTTSLTQSIAETNGLLSTPLAQDLISTSSTNLGGQDLAVRFTLALASLTNLSTLTTDGTLQNALAQILQQDAGFNALSTADQVSLLNALTQEVGASLLKAALAEIATQFGMPGLIPQILAVASGLGGDDALGSLQSQLYFAVTFADELQRVLGISPDAAATAANQAVANGLESESVTQSAVQSLNNQGIYSDNLDAGVLAADIATRQVIADDVAANELSQRQAYADSLTGNLLSQGVLDQTQAARIKAQLVNTNSDQLGAIANNILKGYLSNLEEVQTILAEAQRAALIRDGSVNPLASLTSTAPATSASLNAGFQALAVENLTPALGASQAEVIAANYGSFITNTVLPTLQTHEQNLQKIDNYRSAERLYDDYRNYTDSLRNPTTAADSPLQLGETLLLSANVGGPATAGTTSMDNQLGVFGNININPGGILA